MNISQDMLEKRTPILYIRLIDFEDSPISE